MFEDLRLWRRRRWLAGVVVEAGGAIDVRSDIAVVVSEGFEVHAVEDGDVLCPLLEAHVRRRRTGGER